MLASLISNKFQPVYCNIVFIYHLFVLVIIFVAGLIHFIDIFVYHLFSCLLIYLFIKYLLTENVLSEVAIWMI